MTDYSSIALIVAVPLTAFLSVLYSRSAITKAFKTEQKTAAVERIFETMGFRNFKPADLNSGKMDDKGFERFLILLANVAKWYGPTVATGKNSALSELTALAQGLQGLQPATPQKQNTPNMEQGIPA